MVNTATIANLRQRLNIADDGSIAGDRLSIDDHTLSSLDSDGQVAFLLGLAFTDSNAVLTDAHANAIGQGDDVLINGTCSFSLGQELPTQLRISLDSEQQAQLLFSFCMTPAIAPATPWCFSDSFDDLPASFDYSRLGDTQQSLLNQLQLINTYFHASSSATAVGGIALRKGINFVSEVTLNGIFSIFQSLVPTAKPLLLSGTINIPAAGMTAPVLQPQQYPWELAEAPYGIDLQLSVPLPALTFGSALSLSLQFMRIYSPHSNAWLGKNLSYSPVLAWTGALDIPSASLSIAITAVTPIGTQQVEVVADLSSVLLLPSLAGLADLTGATDLLAALPDGWSAPSGMGVESVGVVLGLNKGVPAILQATAKVGISSQRWTIWDPYFEVDSILCDFSVSNPFNGPELTVRINGEMRICGKTVTAEAVKDDGYQLSLTLGDQVDLPLSSLMSDYLDGISPPSDLTINALSFCAAPGKYYCVMLSMAQQPNPWVIDIGITQLVFSDIELFAMRSSQGGLTGSFSANAALGGLALSAQYDIPGDVLIRADLPTTDLRTIVSTLSGGLAVMPGTFNLDFSESYILMHKQGADYRWEMGTLVSEIGSLAFVVERGTSGWGFAAGLAISMGDISELPEVGSTIGIFASWFPFDDFVLAISSLKDSNFAFPGFKQFNQQSLGDSKIQLPASVQGIDKGFYLYTNTRFTKSNKILGALIDLLGIPEGTQLQAMFSYLTDKKQLQLGISITTFLTPLANVSQRTCQGVQGYQNGCLTGTVFVEVVSGGSFSLGLAGSFKTIIQQTNVEFSVVLALVENGIFVSGTMDNQQPLTFGPLKLGGLALELGISFEGVPSFGFAAELDVAGAFNSSLAVLVDSTNPTKSMIAASLSDMVIGDAVRHLLGPLSVAVPPPLLLVLDNIDISGSQQGRFTVAGQDAVALAKALDNFDGQTISKMFMQYGQLKAFPDSSEGLMLFVDTVGSQWYLTEKSGSASNSMICHWQLYRDAQGQIQISKEAQLYFVPDSAGTHIGKFYYPQGMLISGRIKYLFIDLDVDIELSISKGIKIDADLSKIVLGTERLFSLTSPDGATGPKLSVATYEQPLQPVGLQQPHFLVSGKLQLLGISRSVFVKIDSSGATFQLSGDLVPSLVTGDLNCTIGDGSILDVAGSLFAGIPDIDLGALGTWPIRSGVSAAATIWAKASDFGAGLQASFELAGLTLSLPKISLSIATQSLADLVGILFDAIKSFLSDYFGDAKVWAEMASKVLAWPLEQIQTILKTVFNLDETAIKLIVSTFCPVATALSML